MTSNNLVWPSWQMMVPFLVPFILVMLSFNACKHLEIQKGSWITSMCQTECSFLLLDTLAAFSTVDLSLLIPPGSHDTMFSWAPPTSLSLFLGLLGWLCLTSKGWRSPQFYSWLFSLYSYTSTRLSQPSRLACHQYVSETAYSQSSDSKGQSEDAEE